MHPLAKHIEQLGILIKASLLETAWPTRCVLCDAPETLLCERCYLALPFIDYWKTCPLCGSPYGLVQCCTCNPVMMPPGFSETPFDGCINVVHLTQQTGRMVTLYKDHNERKLALVISTLMQWVIPPSWLNTIDGIVFIPASFASYKKRGFDHAELLAHTLADLLELTVFPVFERPQHIDQRALSRSERFENMQHSLIVSPDAFLPKNPLVIDDVFTTGATLFAASAALREQNASSVHCLTFARA